MDDKNVRYLICDESGAKGYSTQEEQEAGEIGLFLGYLLSVNQIEIIKEKLTVIANKYTAEGKLHITDLASPEQKKELRKDIIDLFKEEEIPLVYNATYVQGFHAQSKLIQNIIDDAPRNTNPDIVSSKNPSKELLHSDLFGHMILKVIEDSINKMGNSFHLKIITDKVDPPIIKKFKQEIEDLVQIIEKTTTPTKAFNKQTREILSGSITMEVKDPNQYLSDYSKISYTIECQDNELTLAADVLANALGYALKSYIQLNSSDLPSLNHKKALSNFPLKDFIILLPEEDNQFYMGDILFAHPDSKA